MIDAARAQLARYPTVRLIEGQATAATKEADGFRVILASGETVRAARIVLAFGVSDELPALPGLIERWGRTVIVCPYCHGYEFAGKQLGVLYGGSMSVHQAALIADWGPTTLYLNGAAPLDQAATALLTGRGVAVNAAPITALEDETGSLARIHLANGEVGALDAMYIAPRARLNSTIAEQLGCALDAGRFGPIIRVDPMKQTTVPGVYAAGDVIQSNNITIAAADGVIAGTLLHSSLVFGLAPHETAKPSDNRR
jgi:thioredoxin reductase